MNKDWTGIKLNLSETVDSGISLMKQAAAEGADMVLFPELWFPGYVILFPK
jgi:predicted amidohydrolase